MEATPGDEVLHPQAPPEEAFRGRLTRQDVLDLIEKNGGPQGLDLRGCDLSGVNLTKLDLHGIVFGNLELLKYADEVDIVTQSGSLEGTWFERSNLRRANFGRTNLRGAHFFRADLTEASLWGANAESADFRKANLTHTDLFSTVLQNCRCADANLTGANFYQTDLRGATFSSNAFGDKIIQESESDYREYYNRWYTQPIVRDRYSGYHLEGRYTEANEIYLNIKNAYLNSGRYDDASSAYFKERQTERKSFFRKRRIMKWLQSLITEAVLGYGERPMRVVYTALLIILIFPFIYWLSNAIQESSGRVLRWIDYLNYSLGAFSTIGFPDLVPNGDIGKFLTSLEALLGISALALLMFALGNRVSRS